MKTITPETVWNDDPSSSATGGDISDLFAVPSWQQDVKLPVSKGSSHRKKRAVPDVASVADPNSGYKILVDGEWGVPRSLQTEKEWVEDIPSFGTDRENKKALKKRD